MIFPRVANDISPQLWNGMKYIPCCVFSMEYTEVLRRQAEPYPLPLHLEVPPHHASLLSSPKPIQHHQEFLLPAYGKSFRMYHLHQFPLTIPDHNVVSLNTYHL